MFSIWLHPSVEPLVIAWVSPEAPRGHPSVVLQQGPQGATGQHADRTQVQVCDPRRSCRCTWMCHQHESTAPVLVHTRVQDSTIQTKTTEITAMSYSPRILRGRRHFEGPFQTVPLSHLSFQEICHKSDECPLIRAMGHCKNGWHAQCARRGVCCTVRNQQKHPHYKPFDEPGAHLRWAG